ncbi:Uncharacterised protein [Burkholderia pseudomallei]|uniref:hypothetical protein n=1 Tax=Burkholderia pseudomallei TaxID=28450 RepID=UPI000F07E02C|nr:hypothetical protein [Burkholderia pseudomallei]VBR62530.1 Uncharacterised protein [Burkholderia pseudomallei]
MATRKEIERTADWYQAIADGFRLMEQQVLKNRFQAGKLGDPYFGDTAQDVADKFRKMRDKSDRFALLALYATCEGGIRADAYWRGKGNNGQMYQSQFKAFAENDVGTFVKLSTILNRWRTAQGDAWFKKHMNNLQDQFRVRNRLAHGNDNDFVADFTATYQALLTIRQKWHSAVHDFQGF